ncbi:hypothetical protein BH23ACT9_BH23ACT9_15610 [soil metagenome]
MTVEAPARTAFAVTTRSALKGYRHFPLMMLASRRIRRQLAVTPGVVRWASIVAGPREFWTLTLWSSRDAMMAFMGSGAHESVMWLFGRWLRAFWLTRWRPTADEVGTWEGLPIAPAPAPAPAIRRTPDQQAALDAALDAFPRLRDSVGEDGAARLETAGVTKRDRREVQGTGTVVVRVVAARRRDAPAVWRSLAALRRALDDRDDVLRRAVGLAGPREAFALVLLRDEAACADLATSAVIDQLRHRWDDGLWVMRWEAANEFGHWDGLRLRQHRHRTDVALPPGAGAAAGQG